LVPGFGGTRDLVPQKICNKKSPLLRPSQVLASAAEEITMAVSRPQAQVPDLLRWGFHNPNPPDPALALILELGTPSVRQAVLNGIARLNLATAQAQVQLWTDVQRAMGQTKSG
jgi:hypothetical protein